jgi:hypothetical protein
MILQAVVEPVLLGVHHGAVDPFISDQVHADLALTG